MLAGGAPGQAAEVTPLARTHAHNDYLHERPLLDAISNGFTSVEADVWLVNGELLVAHELAEVRPGRTLESLYLEPLAEIVKANRDSVYKGYEPSFQLLIDIKSEGASTYLAVDRALREYKEILTKFNPSGVKPGAVTAVISGNRPRDLMASQKVRYAAYDGRLSDLGSDAPASFIPLISDRWTSHFTWNGVGEMPAAERAKLRQILETAHAHGQRVRFWATPDMPSPERTAIWRELLAAGVDYINTDDLAGLRDFLLAEDPNPSQPHVPLAGK